MEINQKKYHNGVMICHWVTDSKFYELFFKHRGILVINKYNLSQDAKLFLKNNYK